MASIALGAGQPRAGLFRPVERDEWIKLGNWLLVWVVIANAGFALMWLIGAPPRWPEIMFIGATGLVVRERARWVQFAAFCVAMVWSVLGFLAGLFNLGMGSLLHSVKFFIELDPAQSSEYLIGAGAIAALIVCAGMALRRPQYFRDTRLVLLAMIAVLALAGFDKWMGYGMRGHYKRAPVAGAPFTSAVGQSGFGASGVAAQRNLLVVMVESMGQPVGNAEMQRLLFARYREPAVTARFELSNGTTTYYNSTTAGEVRELCNRWGDYYDLLDRADGGCLPARLRKAGYETSAYHSFTGGFFDRDKWYPNIGFDRRVFAEDLVGQGLRECGGVFAGACDRDVPPLLAAQLKQGKQPQFVYWLTLNSHLPVPPGLNLEVDKCERVSATLAAEYPMICRQFAIWDAIDAALIKEITAADFPPTDILIVGDHMPPYFDRHHRSQFAPDRVPWLMLRWKGGVSAPVQPGLARAASASDRG
jgi:hypothetical protein